MKKGQHMFALSSFYYICTRSALFQTCQRVLDALH